MKSDSMVGAGTCSPRLLVTSIADKSTEEDKEPMGICIDMDKEEGESISDGLNMDDSEGERWEACPEERAESE